MPLLLKRVLKPPHPDLCRQYPIEIRQLIENHKNRNTKKKTNWAAGVFSSWRNAAGPEFVPEIQLMTVEQMNHYLSRFVVEARKKEVEPYRPWKVCRVQ